jgi:hypothetical protein
MGMLVERYDGDNYQDAPGSPVVNYWEFYNEPDNGDVVHAEHGWGYWGYSGAEYAQMLCAVYPVMKAANPGAKIVLGGMAYERFTDSGGPFVRSFLDDVLAGGGGKCLDLINFHYYPYFESVWSSYGPGIIGKANYLRSKLASLGYGNLPMVCTEAGYSSDDGPGVPSSPEIQSGKVVKLFVQSMATGLKFMIWWTWPDLEGYPGAFGLVDVNFQPKLSYYAFQTAALQLERATFQQSLSSVALGGANAQAYLFQRSGRPFYVLWANGESAESVSLPGSSALVTDYVGGLIAQIADGDDGHVDGLVRITFGADPVYVEITP